MTTNSFQFITPDNTDYETNEVITFNESDTSLSLRDTLTGSTITIYRPKRELNIQVEESDPRWIVVPGYIGASSFNLGDSRHANHRTSEKVIRDAMVFQRMLAIAIHTLNKYNEVITTWPEGGCPNAARIAHDALDRVDYLSRQLKPYADAARAKEELKRNKAKGGK